MGDQKREVLSLPARYYQMWPPSDPAGLVYDLLQLPVEETCFVALHLWNSGYRDGPALPVRRWYMNTGVPQGVEGGADELRRDIIDNRIAPAIALSRRVGLPIVHAQSRRVGSRYPQVQYMLEPDESKDALPEALPGWRRQQAQQVGGFGAFNWDGQHDLDMAPTARPLPEDYVVIIGAQLDRILRSLGVVNLIYTGFHVGTCITNSPAAMREMSLRYGYRVILLRECTLNLECPDSLPGLNMTRAAIRIIEQHVGYTARLDDFMATCRAVAQARGPREPRSFSDRKCLVHASWPP